MFVKKMGNITLLNIDCMEYMAGLPNKAFDLAIVDPPYGIGITNGFDITKSSRPNHKRNVLNGYVKYVVKDWDNTIPDEMYFNELFRVSNNQIIWGGNYFTDFITPSKGWIFWDKGADYEASFNFSHGELAFTSFDKRLMKIFISPKIETNGGKDKIHPTQKPIKLYKWLLKNYAKPGDKILDTHGGSMSSAIACHQMGFDLVLTEIDKDYYEAGLKRFKEAIKQQTLFDYQ